MKTYKVHIIDKDIDVEVQALDEADLHRKLMKDHRDCSINILSMEEEDTRDVVTKALQDYFPPSIF